MSSQNQEHTYIESYLDGELDWELLVDAVGEDMARGVRIAEQWFEDEYKGDIFEDDMVMTDMVTAIVSDSIKRNGKIAQRLDLV